MLNGVRVLLLRGFTSCFGGVDLISNEMNYGLKDCRRRAVVYVVSPNGADIMQGNVGVSFYIGFSRQSVPTGGQVSRKFSARPYTVRRVKMLEAMSCAHIGHRGGRSSNLERE